MLSKLGRLVFICGLSTQALAQSQPETAVWTGVGGNNDHTRYVATPSDAAHFKVLWSKQFIDPRANDGGYVGFSITSKALYVFSTTVNPAYQGLTAVNLDTGEPIWKQPYPRGMHRSSEPSFANGNLYYLMTNENTMQRCYVTAFNAVTGKAGYSIMVGCRDIDTFESPMIFDNHLYITASPIQSGTIQHFTYDMDLSSGKLLHTFNIHGMAAPLINQDYIFTDSQNTIHANNRSDGQLAFVLSTPLTSRAFTFYVNSVYDAATKTAFVTYFEEGDNGYIPYLYAFDTVKQTIKWSRQLTGYVHAPAFADNTLYMVADRILYAINAATGEDLWQWKIDEKHTDMYEYQSSYIPVVTQNHVIISGMGYTYAVNRATHAKEWELDKSGTLELGEHAFYLDDDLRNGPVTAVAIN